MEKIEEKKKILINGGGLQVGTVRYGINTCTVPVILIIPGFGLPVP